MVCAVCLTMFLERKQKPATTEIWRIMTKYYLCLKSLITNASIKLEAKSYQRTENGANSTELDQKLNSE